MCGRKLKIFLLQLVAPLLLFCSPCFAEVKLSNEEAQTLLTEITEAKKDLLNVQNELEESKNEVSELLKESSEQKVQLNELQNTLSEQKQSYEMQLKKEKNKNKIAWTLTGVSGTGCTVLGIILLIVLL